MTLARRVAAGTRALAVGNLGGAVLSFALSALIGRGVGVDGLGIYAVALAWAYPLTLLVEFGLGTLLTRDAADDLALANTYLRAIVVQRMIVGGVVMLGLITAATWITPDPLTQRAIVISAPLVIVGPFFNAFSAVFRARGAMRPPAALNIGMLIAQVMLTIGVLLSGGGVLAVLAVNTLTSAGQVIAAWVIWRRAFFVPVEGDRLDLRSLMRAAWPFAIAGVLAAIASRLPVLALERLSSTTEAGWFNAASRFIDAARVLPNAAFGALLPALAAAARMGDTVNNLFTRTEALLILYGVIVASGLIVGARFLITLVYDQNFVPSAPVLIVLAIGLFPSLLRAARTLRCYADRREAWVNRVTLIALIVQAVICVILIPAWGAMGAAVALIVTDTVAWGGLLWSGGR